MADVPRTTVAAFSRRMLLGGLASVAALRQANVVLAMGNADDSVGESVCTRVCVRVIARDGKVFWATMWGARRSPSGTHTPGNYWRKEQPAAARD